MNDTTLILKAATFAARKHRDQRRKDADASPYINHPLELARVLAEVGGVTDPATLCAALLHDTIEDTATTHQELADEFGRRSRRWSSRSPMTRACRRLSASACR